MFLLDQTRLEHGEGYFWKITKVEIQFAIDATESHYNH